MELHLQSLKNKKIDEEDIECAIDEDVVECDGLDYEDQYYTGVPAPVLNPIASGS